MKTLKALPLAAVALLAPALAAAQVTVSDNATSPALQGRPRDTVVLSNSHGAVGHGFIPEFHTVVRCGVSRASTSHLLGSGPPCGR